MSDTSAQNAPVDPTISALLNNAGILAPQNSGSSAQSGAPVSSDVSSSATQSANDAYKGFFGDITAKLGQAAGAVQAAFSAGQGVGAASAASSNQQSQATLAAGATQAAIDSGDATMKAKAEADTAAAYAKAGFIGPAFDKTLADIQQKTGELRDFQNKRDAADNVGFFDNPLKYIYNQVVTVPTLNTQIQDRTEDLRNQTTAASAAANTLSVGEQAINAVDSVNTNNRAALLSTLDLQKATVAAQDPLIKQAQINISALGLAVSAAGELVKSEASLAHIPMEEQSAGYYGAVKQSQILLNQEKAQAIADHHNQLPLIDAETEARLKNAKLANQELTGKLADYDNMNKLGNVAVTSFGLPSIETIAKLPTDTRTALVNMGASIIAGGGAGPDPVSALTNIEKAQIPVTSLVGAQTQTVKDIQNQKSKMLSDPNLIAKGTALGLKGKDLENYILSPENVTAAYQHRYSMLSDDPTHQDKLFSPQPLAGVLKQQWAQSNPILQAMAPMVLDGNGRTINSVPTRFQDVLSTAKMLVDTGKLDRKQVPGFVADIARNSLSDNDRAYGFRRFGFGAVIDPDHYRVALPRPGALFGGNVPGGVDMLNAGSVLSYLSQLDYTADLHNAAGEK